MRPTKKLARGGELLWVLAPSIVLCLSVAVWGEDCNRNGIEDDEEILQEVANDCDQNGIPDDCDGPPVRFAERQARFSFSDRVRLVRLGDVDGDRKVEVVVGTRVTGSPSKIFVLSGDSEDFFSISAEYDAGENLHWLELGDVDGDGDLDAVTANSELVLLFQNSAGRFSEPQPLQLRGESRFVALADLDGDGAPEILVANRGESSVSVFDNDGDGRFVAAGDLGLESAAEQAADPVAMAAADLDGDGDLDLGTLNKGAQSLSILFNNGAGEFAKSVNYEFAERVSATAGLWALDLNDDDARDFLFQVAERTLVALNAGDGTFGELREINFSATALTPGDFNGDGAVDLAGSSGPGGVAACLNIGGLRCGPLASFDSPLSATFVEAGDLDSDGDLDLAVVVPPASVSLLWNGAGSRLRFTTEKLSLFGCTSSAGCAPHAGVLADLDGDGDLDAVSANTHPGSFSVAVNRSGMLVVQTGLPFGVSSADRPQSLAAGDLDGDGDIDLATSDISSHSLWIHLNTAGAEVNAHPAFERPASFATGVSPIHVALADLDNDGDLDAVTANQGGASISVLYNDGAGRFEPGEVRDFQVDNAPKATALADYDGDGWRDIAVANSGTNAISVLFNRRDRSFAPKVNTILAGRPSYVHEADLDNDGDVDLITVNRPRSVSILLNDGDGEFGRVLQHEIGRTPYSAEVGDMDGDGILDLVTANETTDTLSVLFGFGDGRFIGEMTLDAGPGVRFAPVGDLDGDGDLDIVTMDREGESFTLLRHRSSTEVGSAAYLESICTAREFYELARQGRSHGPVERFVKYTLPVRDDPSLLPTLFQDTQEFQLHQDFLSATFPERFPLLDAAQFDALVGRRATREYFVGAISRLLTPAGAVYGFSVSADFTSEVERLSATEVKEIFERLGATFLLEPFAYFPSSGPAEAVARTWNDPGLPIVFGEEVREVDYQAYTPGVAFGRVSLLSPAEFAARNQRGTLSFQDILVLTGEPPRDMEGVVGGIATAERQNNPLSHLAVRSARRGTPNAFIADAATVFAPFVGQLVRYEVSDDDYTLTAATGAEAEAFWEATRRHPAVVPSVDAEFSDLLTLDEIAALDLVEGSVKTVSRFGGKATNFARLQRLLVGDWSPYRAVGLAIPMHFYLEFMRTNFIPSLEDAQVSVTYEEFVRELLADERFRSDPSYRFEVLAELREEIVRRGMVEPSLVRRVALKVSQVFPSTTERVRCRSSSNVEDGLEFNGAGLYDSVSACAADDLDADEVGPSRCNRDWSTERGIARALKMVWASAWNFRAYEERQYFGVPQEATAMGVLISKAFVDELANGVAFTGNPNDRDDRRYLVVSQVGEVSVANADLGAIPEQTLVEVSADGVRIQRLRNSSLVPEGQVLSDDRLRELGRLLAYLDGNFPVDLGDHGRDDVLLDLEFKIDTDQSLRVKQIRPFLHSTPEAPQPTFELSIPPATVACGQFVIGRGPRVEWERKSTVRLRSGSFFLPTRESLLTETLVEELVVGQQRHVAVPDGPGELRWVKSPLPNGRSEYLFSYEQRFALAGVGPVRFQIGLLSFSARDGHPEESVLVVDETALTDRLLLAATVGTGQAAAEIVYGSCTYNDLPLFEIRLELEEGISVLLRERFGEELVWDWGPAALVWAEIAHAGERRAIGDYWNLVYAAEKHNENVVYGVALDPPLAVSGLDRPASFLAVAVAERRYSYLDDAFLPIAEAALLSYAKEEVGGASFRRGDVTADGVLDVADPISLLHYLFLNGAAPTCFKAADSDDSGALGLADSIRLLRHLFLGGPPPAEPFTACGADPTPDTLSCERFGVCR